MKTTTGLTAVVCVGVMSGPVFAGMNSVDPDAFPAGTDISNAFPGVTLSAVGGGLGVTSSAIFARDPGASPAEPYAASTGALSFGTNAGSARAHFSELSPLDFRADFANPVSAVSLDFIGNDPLDTGSLAAFDSGGTQIDFVATSGLSNNEVERLTVTSATSSIAYIVATGTNGHTIGLDNMTYVPTPAGLALMAPAGVLLASRRRR